MLNSITFEKLQEFVYWGEKFEVNPAQIRSKVLNNILSSSSGGGRCVLPPAEFGSKEIMIIQNTLISTGNQFDQIRNFGF